MREFGLADERRGLFSTSMTVNTPLNSVMIVLDNKSLGQECFPFWIFDVQDSTFYVDRNLIPFIDSKHKSSDHVRDTIPFHFLVTFLVLQGEMNRLGILSKLVLEH